MTNPITAVYNEHTAAAGLNLKYEAEEISDWELFWMDVQHIIFGKWMKVAAAGTLIFGSILACVCPSFAPTFLITLGCVGLTLTIGGIVAGIQNGEKNGGFQRGFVNYINDNWAFTLASELIIAMACFGISKAVAAIQNAGAKKPATGTKTEQAVEPVQAAQAELAEYELDPRSIELAKEGDPSFSTFRKRVWQYEAQFHPEKYEENVANMLKGKAPYRNGSKVELHHVKGRALDNYDVVALTREQHIQFHKRFKYHQNDDWNMTNIRAMFGGEQ